MTSIIVGDHRHNHNKKLAWMLKKGLIIIPEGEVFHITIRHDDYCKVLKRKPGICNCDPEIIQGGGN